MSSNPEYLLAGKTTELARLQLQSRVREAAGRELLDSLTPARRERAVDVGCGVMGWLRILPAWVEPNGSVVGSDIDDKMLAAAAELVRSSGRDLPSLMRSAGLSPHVSAHVIAVETGHPYLRLPLQFAAALRARLESLVDAGALHDLLQRCDEELARDDAWGTTFTLIQAHAIVS